jgi:peptidoglycan hydrolase CwlO-like protein
VIFGSACTVSEADALKPTPRAIAQLNAKLHSSRAELRNHEEELVQLENKIKAAREDFSSTVPPRLLAKREQLRKEVFELKVNIRELEILLNEEP